MTGIPCPECGSYDSAVMHTDKSDGTILRRRKCVVCGVRFTTTERVVGSFETPATTSSRVLQVTIGRLAESLDVLRDLTGTNIGNANNHV